MRQVNIEGMAVDITFHYHPGRFPQRRWIVIAEVCGIHVSESANTQRNAYRAFALEVRETIKNPPSFAAERAETTNP